MMYMQYPREPDQLLRRVVKRLTPPLPHLSEIPGCWYERKIIHNYLIGIIFSLLDLNKLHGVALQNNNNRKRTTNTSKWRIHMSNKVECILIILFKPWIHARFKYILYLNRYYRNLIIIRLFSSLLWYRKDIIRITIKPISHFYQFMLQSAVRTSKCLNDNKK